MNTYTHPSTYSHTAYICIYSNTHTYTNAFPVGPLARSLWHTHTHTKHTHTNTYAYTHMHTHTHTQVQHIYTHTHTHTLSLYLFLSLPLSLSHTHTCTYTHTRTHTPTQGSQREHQYQPRHRRLVTPEENLSWEIVFFHLSSFKCFQWDLFSLFISLLGSQKQTQSRSTPGRVVNFTLTSSSGAWGHLLHSHQWTWDRSWLRVPLGLFSSSFFRSFKWWQPGTCRLTSFGACNNFWCVCPDGRLAERLCTGAP